MSPPKAEREASDFEIATEPPPSFLFLLASAREAGHIGNTETLARRAASVLPLEIQQQWLRLADAPLPAFVDQRHTLGVYPMPEGAAKQLLDASMACTDLVLVAPVYWYSFPAALKSYLDHWSAWMRVPGLGFKDAMAKKRLWLIVSNGERETAEPMIASTRLCASFLSMPLAGVLWGKGGPPGAIESDATAMQEALGLFTKPCVQDDHAPV